jgi:phage terminase large subunit-like protein
LIWPSGAVGLCFSSEKPDRLRGPSHHLAWADELAAWNDPQKTWDNLLLGLRLGRNPRCMITTTPRPIQLIKELIKDPTCAVTRGTSYDNRANLSPVFYDQIIRRYEGTRLGRQELLAELLTDNPDAIFNRALIDTGRVTDHPDLERIVVGVDPALSTGENSDSTGIVVAGMSSDMHFYVLGDFTCKKTPEGWGQAVVSAYHHFDADTVVPELNNGGDLVISLLRLIDPLIPIKPVHATRGKHIRAEPIAALYEQGRVHHVGSFPKLEDEMCSWSPNLPEKSPDRMDAIVWALTALSSKNKQVRQFQAVSFA